MRTRLACDEKDQIGFLGGTERAIFGRSYAAEPVALIAQLKQDEAIAEADTLLLTVPNQLGVEYNAHLLESFAAHIGPAIGWTRAHERADEPAPVS